MKFSDRDKVDAVSRIVVMLNETASCTPDEIKRLFHPKMIDKILEVRGEAIIRKAQHK